MSKLIAASILSVLFFGGEAGAQCTGWPTTLQNGLTADASQVMADLNYLGGSGCLAPSASPTFTGYVAIGNVTPMAPLQFKNASSPTAGVANAIRLWDNSTGTSSYGFGVSTGSLDVISNNSIGFYNGGNESVRITAAGNVGIGTTAPLSALTVQSGNGDLSLVGTTGNSLSTAGRVLFYDNTNFAWDIFAFHNDGNFYLQNNGGSTNMRVVSGTNSWAATSDVRLKTNIKTLPILDRLQNYRAVSFDWKQTGRHDVGVVAQELYKVFPEVVNRGSDGALSGPTDSRSWSVQYDKLGALALEAAKELKAENDALREANRVQAAQLETLEARLARVERLLQPPTTVALRH